MQLSLRSALRTGALSVVLLLSLVGQAMPARAAVTANDDAAVVAEDTPVDIPVLVNDFSDGAPPAIAAVAPGAHGTTSIVGSTVRYVPDPDFAGSDTFTYDSAADGFTSTATVFVTVIGANDPPIAVADGATTPEETAVVIPVLANDSDPDGDPVGLLAVGPASFGTSAVAGSTVSYLPDLNYVGSDLFTYTISDGAGGLATGVISITVAPLNDAPQATDDAAGTFLDTAVSIAVTVNDTDVDGDPISVSGVGAAANGTTSIDGPGTIEYVPDAGFAGIDSFSYSITDPSGATDTAVVTVTVSATNRPPAAVDDFAVAGHEDAVTVAVLANDTDPDGDALNLLAIGAPARGTAILNGDGTVTYTPGAGFSGLDAFSYTAGDGHGGTDSGTVTISVAPAAGAPVINPDTALVPEDGTLDIAVLANDVGELALAVQSVGNAAHGTVSLRAGGTIRYSPVADYFGPDSFTYVATDLSGASSAALVAITVAPVNDAPLAVADGSRSEGGSPVELDLLANDSDVEGDELSAVLVTSPSSGTVLLVEGIARYEPQDGFVGIDSFRYEACDAELCDAAIVTIEVTASSPLPPIEVPPDAVSLPQTPTASALPPLNSKPVISPSIGLNLASSATLESLGVLFLPLTLLAVVMVWVLSANNFPFLFFWWRKRKAEDPPPIA
jgi:hypothetical protein